MMSKIDSVGFEMISTFQHLLFVPVVIRDRVRFIAWSYFEAFSLLALEAKQTFKSTKTKPFSINITWYGKYVR